jgi:hypothetical protein
MRATASFVGAKAEKSLKSFVPSATSGPKQVRSTAHLSNPHGAPLSAAVVSCATTLCTGGSTARSAHGACSRTVSARWRGSSLEPNCNPGARWTENFSTPRHGRRDERRVVSGASNASEPAHRHPCWVDKVQPACLSNVARLTASLRDTPHTQTPTVYHQVAASSPYWRPYWGAFQSQESPHAPGWAGLAVPSARLPSCVTLVASPIRHTTVARAPVRCGFRLLALARLKASRGAGSPYRRAYSPPGSPRRVIERVTEEREARGYLGIQWPCSLRRGRASEPCTTDAPSLTHSSPRCPCCTGD